MTDTQHVWPTNNPLWHSVFTTSDEVQGVNGRNKNGRKPEGNTPDYFRNDITTDTGEAPSSSGEGLFSLSVHSFVEKCVPLPFTQSRSPSNFRDFFSLPSSIPPVLVYHMTTSQADAHRHTHTHTRTHTHTHTHTQIFAQGGRRASRPGTLCLRCHHRTEKHRVPLCHHHREENHNKMTFWNTHV